MENKKKKIIIGLIVGAVLLVSALAIGISISIKKEKEAQEVARLEQEQKEKEAQELKEQQEQEEKERQERLAKLEEGWNALTTNQEYMTLGSEHISRIVRADRDWAPYEYSYSQEFIGTLYMIADGWYNGASKEDLDMILNTVLNNLPDNATNFEVYEALMGYTELVPRWTAVTGVGTSPLDDITQVDESSTQTTNNNTSSGGSTTPSGNNNSSGNTNPSGNTTSSDNGSQQQNSNNSSNDLGGPDMDGDGDYDLDDFLSQFGGSGGPTGNPEDNAGELEDDDVIFG